MARGDCTHYCERKHACVAIWKYTLYPKFIFLSMERMSQLHWLVWTVSADVSVVQMLSILCCAHMLLAMQESEMAAAKISVKNATKLLRLVCLICFCMQLAWQLKGALLAKSVLVHFIDYSRECQYPSSCITNHTLSPRNWRSPFGYRVGLTMKVLALWLSPYSLWRS